MTTKPRPLSIAERDFIRNNPEMPVADLAKALDRPEKDVPTLLAESVKQGTPFYQAAKMQIERKDFATGRKKKVGAIMTPQASTILDDNRGALAPTGPARTPPSPKTGKPANCVHQPMGAD
jgi:hypothetical protein